MKRTEGCDYIECVCNAHRRRRREKERDAERALRKDSIPLSLCALSASLSEVKFNSRNTQ